MTSPEERIGLNEAAFRDVNERIEELAENFDLGSAPIDLICECGDAGCAQPIAMSRAEYEELRSDPHQFAVYPGHEIPGIEQLIAKRKGYVIVAKNQGAPEQIAEQTDPRA
jgi:hypothetical protein